MVSNRALSWQKNSSTLRMRDYKTKFLPFTSTLMDLKNTRNQSPHSLLSTVYCLLFTVYCLLPTVYRLPSTVYCLLSTDSVDLKGGLMSNRICTVKFWEVESYFGLSLFKDYLVWLTNHFTLVLSRFCIQSKIVSSQRFGNRFCSRRCHVALWNLIFMLLCEEIFSSLYIWI